MLSIICFYLYLNKYYLYFLTRVNLKYKLFNLINNDDL